MPGLAVRGTFSPARAWRPAVGPASPQTLGRHKSAAPAKSTKAAVAAQQPEQPKASCSSSPRERGDELQRRKKQPTVALVRPVFGWGRPEAGQSNTRGRRHGRRVPAHHPPGAASSNSWTRKPRRTIRHGFSGRPESLGFIARRRAPCRVFAPCAEAQYHHCACLSASAPPE